MWKRSGNEFWAGSYLLLTARTKKKKKNKKKLLFWTPGNAFITKGYGKTLLALGHSLTGKNSFSHFSFFVVLFCFLRCCFIVFFSLPRIHFSHQGWKLMEVISYAKSFGTVYQFDLMKYLESDGFFLRLFYGFALFIIFCAMCNPSVERYVCE